MMVPRGAHICQLRTTHQGYAPKAPLSGVPRRDAGASSGKRRWRVPGDWGVKRWLIFAAHNSKTSQVKPRSCGSVPAIRSPRRRPTSGSAKGPITASCHRDGRFRDRASIASAFDDGHCNIDQDTGNMQRCRSSRCTIRPISRLSTTPSLALVSGQRSCRGVRGPAWRCRATRSNGPRSSPPWTTTADRGPAHCQPDHETEQSSRAHLASSAERFAAITTASTVSATIHHNVNEQIRLIPRPSQPRRSRRHYCS